MLSYRRSTGERRQQLKWLMSGSALVLISLLVGFTGLAGTVGGVFVLGFLALPLSIGVAVLKYGLFEIDRIISRTLAYTIVTGLLVGVYAGIVLLSTRLLSLHLVGGGGGLDAGRGGAVQSAAAAGAADGGPAVQPRPL